jgi:hypothetical protein
VKPRGQPSYVERYRWAVLFDAPEVDTLSALHTRQSSTLFAELKKAWMGEALGFSYADEDKRLPIEAHSYRLALVVGVQPKRAGVLFEEADGGLPQRFLWFPTPNPAAPDVRPPELAPWPWSPLFLVDVRGPIPVCQVARDYIDDHYLTRHRGEGHTLDAHSALARLKVAAALALLDQRAEVTEDDWRLAAVPMGVSDRTRAAVVEVLTASRSSPGACVELEASGSPVPSSGRPSPVGTVSTSRRRSTTFSSSKVSCLTGPSGTSLATVARGSGTGWRSGPSRGGHPGVDIPGVDTENDSGSEASKLQNRRSSRNGSITGAYVLVGPGWTRPRCPPRVSTPGVHPGQRRSSNPSSERTGKGNSASPPWPAKYSTGQFSC